MRGFQQAVVGPFLVVCLVFAGLAISSAAGAVDGTVVINEIHYNPDEPELEDQEFFEIHNPGDTDVNLAGYTVDDEGSAPDNTVTLSGTLEAGAYAIIVPEDSTVSWAVTPIAMVPFGLSGGGDTITIRDANGTVVDEVTYDDKDPWPTAPDGAGPSLELIDALSDNSVYTAWAASDGLPTPGLVNSVVGVAPKDPISQVVATPFEPTANQNVTVVATVLDVGANPVLHWRRDFGAEQTVTMNDAGNGPDVTAGDDVFSATIPKQGAGDLIRYRITTADGRVFPEGDDRLYEGVVVADPAEIPTGLVTMEWFIPDGDYDLMFDDPTVEDLWVDGSVLAIDGVVYDNMSVKIRGGQFARQNREKQGLSFDFAGGVDADVPQLVPHPIDEFALAAEWGNGFDRTYAAWELFEDAGFPEVPGQHVRVQRNGDFYGLFRFTEKLDGTWRDVSGIDGEFYKATSSGFAIPSNFEKKQPDDNDYSNLNALASGLNNSPSPAFMFNNFDVPNLVNFLAAANLTGHFDSEGQNFYMHRQESGLWQVYPWDLTNTFGVSAAFNGCGDTDNLWVSCNDNPLWNAVEDTPALEEMVWRRMRTLLDTTMANGELESRVGQYLALVSNAEIDFDDDLWLDSPSYRDAGDFNVSVDERRALFLASGDLPSSQVGVSGVVVTELVHSAVDDGPDWLELHNTSGESVDLSGWSIDGVGLTVPGGTVLLAGDRLVATRSVADFLAAYPGLPNVVVVEFEKGLSGGGEEVELLDADGVQVDVVDYLTVAPWPTEPNAGVVSLSLFEDEADNSVASSWGVSVQVGGTPGAVNDTVPSVPDPPPAVVINEIHYNPAEDIPDGVEFIELFNAEGEAVDMSGWVIGEFADDSTVLPAGTTIAADGYVVLTEDLAAFSALYPGVAALELVSGGLGGGGDDVVLETDAGVEVDSVSYTDDPPWPGKHDDDPSPDGEGPSLELIDPALDNSLGSSWESSLVDGGTPGVTNIEVDVEVPDSMIDDPGILEAGVIEISGSASDDVSGVARVRVRVRRDADGKFWNGSAWVVSANTWLLADGTDAWSLGGITAAVGEYTAWAFAVDVSGKVEGWADGRPSISFEVLGPDTVAPDSMIDDLGVLDPGLVTVTGTATDDRVVVDLVRVRVRRDSDGLYWNGAGWVSVANSWLLANGTDTWSLEDVPMVAGTYSVRAYAVDAAGNVEGWADGRPSRTLVVAADDTAPDSSIDPIGTVDAGVVEITGTASDDRSGVNRVRVRVRRNADFTYWNGAAWVPGANTWVTADGTDSWSLDGVPVVEGTYSVRAYAIDNESNVEGWGDVRPARSFTVLGPDDTPPDTVIDDVVVAAGEATVSGTASDDRSGVDRVRVRVRRNADGTYWNGANWVSNANTWLTADGTDSWSLDGVPVTNGSYTATAYAIDNELNVEGWPDGRPMFTLNVNGV